MITSQIFFKNFKLKKKNTKIKNNLSTLIKENNQIILSLSSKYKNSFKKEKLINYKKFRDFRVIGMGGSILGTQAIYDFLKHKIKKNFFFIDNLQPLKRKIKSKKLVNLIISKSGNTIETIVNSNILIKKKDQNIFITENKNNYLYNLAHKLKSDVIHHNNFIGGRYSVLSEVGMLPAELMGLKSTNFRQFNSLIKNKKFLNELVLNVSSIIRLNNNKKFNSIIINYDKKSENFFKWYQQLVAESLGKNKKGLLPIISNMPKDNHSLMQLYLDGFQKNFFTFFYVHPSNSSKLNNNLLMKSHKFLKTKKLSDIIYAQKKASETLFEKKKIPFRSFEIKKRNEKTLGELFTFFILETILIGEYFKINPYNQPSVELLKTETKKFLF